MEKEKPNLILLCLDSARADRFSCYGYARGTTPNLDALARRGVLFRNAISAAPWTVPSHASLFTGLYSRDHRTVATHMPPDVGPTLAEVLSEAGYATLAISANPWVSQRTGLLRGFGTVVELRPTGFRDDIGRVRRGAGRRAARIGALLGFNSGWLYADARQVNSAILSMLKNAPQPFALFVNYMDTHAPYLPAWPRAAGWRPSLKGAVRRLAWWRSVDRGSGWDALAQGRTDLLQALGDFYDGDLAAVDAQLGDLIESLDSRRSERAEVMMVLSDHGENLGEHGLVGHFGCLYDSLVRVPLIVRAPMLPAGVAVDSQVQLNDIMPSVLGLLEIVGPVREGVYRERPRLFALDALQQREWPAYSEYYPGEHIDTWQRRAPLFDFSPLRRTLRAVRTGKHKYVAASQGRSDLFDLSEDPAENRSLLENGSGGDLRALAEQMGTALDRWLPAPQWKSETEDSTRDREVEEQLRGLGYL